VSPAYDLHPEFGYLSHAPGFRRELRVAVVSILFGMIMGAAIVNIGAGHATDGVPGNLSDTSAPGVAEPSSHRLMIADTANPDTPEAIKPYPMRTVRVRSSKAASPLAGIPLGQTARAQPDSVPASAGPAPPENAQDPGSPAASPPAQSSAANAEPTVAGARKRTNSIYARRHRDDDNENARWQNRRAPYWGERAYADDRYWRGAYRNWVY
jgi:hypothetical protein